MALYNWRPPGSGSTWTVQVPVPEGNTAEIILNNCHYIYDKPSKTIEEENIFLKILVKYGPPYYRAQFFGEEYLP